MSLSNIVLFLTTAVVMICTPGPDIIYVSTRGMIGYFIGGLGDRLAQQPRIVDLMKRFSGSILIGLGLRMALPERR